MPYLDHDHENDVIYFARTNYRKPHRKFGIRTDDRRRHTYVIGKTGMGKSVLLENMILADIYLGHGCAYVDPHGDTAEKLLDYIPDWRREEVVYFNPADVDYPIGFNILEAVDDTKRHVVASGLMGVFKKIWPDVWSARMEHILNNCILTLLENPGNSLLGINRILVDKDFRRKMIAGVKDPVVKAFWVTEFEQWEVKFRQEAIAPIQNKVGQFLSTALVRNIVAQQTSTISARKIMDEKKIFIVNLSKGRIGEDSMRLLGGMLITKFQLSAMERVDMPEADRLDFYLYIDEFQNFATESFASILSEARKYRLSLIMAHQYIEQLTEEVRAAVFGNVGTIIMFRVGSPDAVFLETEFTPRFTQEDLVSLAKYQIYLRLMINGVASEPFSASTLPPIAQHTHSSDAIIESSRHLFARPRKAVEEAIMAWSEMGGEGNGDMQKVFDKIDDQKKEAKQAKKPQHKYNCSRCGKDMVLPVELDTSRPIYCEDCIELVRAERKQGKSSSSTPSSNLTPKPASATPPTMTSGELVTKEPSMQKDVGLSALARPVSPAPSVKPPSSPQSSVLSAKPPLSPPVLSSSTSAPQPKPVALKPVEKQSGEFITKEPSAEVGLSALMGAVPVEAPHRPQSSSLHPPNLSQPKPLTEGKAQSPIERRGTVSLTPTLPSLEIHPTPSAPIISSGSIPVSPSNSSVSVSSSPQTGSSPSVVSSPRTPGMSASSTPPISSSEQEAAKKRRRRRHKKSSGSSSSNPSSVSSATPRPPSPSAAQPSRPTSGGPDDGVFPW